MKITYDKKADAINIVFKKGRVKKTLEIAPEDVRITCLDGHSYEQEVFIEAGVVTKSAQDRNTMNLLADRLLHAVVDAAPDVLVECHMYPITGIAFKRFRPDEQDVENKLPPV